MNDETTIPDSGQASNLPPQNDVHPACPAFPGVAKPKRKKRKPTPKGKKNLLRKPRGDGVLKSLPLEKQMEIIAMVGPMTYSEAVEVLETHGIHTNISSLCVFRHWWHLTKAFDRAHNDTEAFKAELRRDDPSLNEEEITRRGNRYFNLRAIEIGDNKEWVNTQKLKIAKDQLELEKRRVELMEKKDARAEETKAPAVEELSVEEQERRINAIFGTD